jgi:nucleoside diphosphate kinase
MTAFRKSFVGEDRQDLDPVISRAFDNYMKEYYEQDDSPRRVMLLVFEGSNAINEIRQRVGSPRALPGTISSTREKFAHCRITDGKIVYFEPTVFIPFDSKTAERGLRLFAEHSEKEPGVLEGIIDWDMRLRGLAEDRAKLEDYMEKVSKRLKRQGLPNSIQEEDLYLNIQRTIFMVKPPCLSEKPHLPGTFLSDISGVGRAIIGVRYFNMSVGQFEQFYGHLKEGALKDKPGEYERLCKTFTGHKPTASGKSSLGRQDARHACLAFVYEGPYMVPLLRDILGPTDPKKGCPGQVRFTYAHDKASNLTHGSDSADSYNREKMILNFDARDLPSLVATHFRQVSP